jgi:integrase/recombinase XerD
MEPKFEQFIRERQYLANVTPTTIEWYRRCLKWLPSVAPTQEQLTTMVIAMRERGLKETGVNCVLRCVNAYLHWSHAGSDTKCSPSCKHPRARRLREPKTMMPTFTESQVNRLVAWKPKGTYQRRLHLLILFLLDTGCRISEALSLRVSDIDLDNLLVTLDGKGRKQRVVPISFELRRALARHLPSSPDHLVFATRSKTRMNRRNVLRSVRDICLDLGFTPPARTLHSFRHTFATNYLRRGGSVFHLQKCLGHSTLEMSRRYANLGTADLSAIHERISLLKKGTR